jgi:hypothetical protein
LGNQDCPTYTGSIPAYASGCRVRDPVYSIMRITATKDATPYPSVGRSECISDNQGTPVLYSTTEKGQSVEAVDWLFGRMSPETRSHGPLPNNQIAQMLCQPHKVLWYEHVNAPTCIDTATSPLSCAVFITPKWSHN